MSILSNIMLANGRNYAIRPGYALTKSLSTKPPQDSKNVGDEEFRVLNITGKVARPQRREFKMEEASPPRFHDMKENQDWGSVWPGPRVFHPATVPLPMRQGYIGFKKNRTVPSKWANAELMKVPNFLHLTPPVIKRQCAAIKQFCTEWPKGLDTDDKCDEHYPIESITTDYCHSGPSIRDPLSRIAALRIKLETLKLDKHAKDKILRLVGDRYDPDTDVLTITADRCPLKKQNLDYAMYLLTASFYESWKREPWEEDRVEDDMEYYDWERNPSKTSAICYHLMLNGNYQASDADIASVDVNSIPNIDQYRTAVCDLHNNGETEEELLKYKDAVLKFLDLPPILDYEQKRISA